MKFDPAILIGLMFFSFGCDSVSNNDQELNSVKLLKQEWVNSYEEQTDNIKIFRPADYKDFPISRYRQIFIFKDNNICDYYVLADNDGHYFKRGKWLLKDNDQLIVITDSADHIKYQLEIVELTENLLKCIYVY